MANVTIDKQEPTAVRYCVENLTFIYERLDFLKKECESQLISQDFNPNDMEDYEYYLNLRYEGTDNAVMTMAKELKSDYADLFVKKYKQEYGFVLNDRSIIIDDFRVVGR